MSTGDNPRVTGTTVLELDESEASLDLAAAVRAGVRAVRLTSTRHLSPDDPGATLGLVRLLREAVADGVNVEWRVDLPVDVEPDLLVHLPPPMPEPGDVRIEEWRRRHQPGLCYYRLGPGFVFVKDMRLPDAAARFRLEGEEIVRAFRALEAVVEIGGLDAASRRLLEELEAESLALRLGDLATLLPNRMRRWPVPSHSV